MSDTPQLDEQKREYYLQIMQKAQQMNDKKLIRLILKKLARLGRASAATTTTGCMIIPFPSAQYAPEFDGYERESWWTLFKLALAVPGILIALMLLAHYRAIPFNW